VISEASESGRLEHIDLRIKQVSGEDLEGSPSYLQHLETCWG
jgi:hypothetical protein